MENNGSLSTNRLTCRNDTNVQANYLGFSLDFPWCGRSEISLPFELLLAFYNIGSWGLFYSIFDPIFGGPIGPSESDTNFPSKNYISPQNPWLEDVFPIEIVPF